MKISVLAQVTNALYPAAQASHTVRVCVLAALCPSLPQRKQNFSAFLNNKIYQCPLSENHKTLLKF